VKTTHSVSAILVGCAILSSGCSGGSTSGDGRQQSATQGGSSAGGGSKGGNSSATGSQIRGGSSSAAGGNTTTNGQTLGGSSYAAGGTRASTGGQSTRGGGAGAGGSAASTTAVGGKSATGGTAGAAGTRTDSSSGAGGVVSSAGASSTHVNGDGGTTAAAGRAGAGGASAAGASSVAGSSSNIAKTNFDWVGVVGSGQSLSTGFTPARLTTPDPNNLMLKLGTTSFPGTGPDNPNVPVPGTSDKPWDSTMSDLTVVPLVEPLREAGSGYPRPYPINLWGETSHGAMARQLTNFVSSYVTVHTVVGESGKGITALIKQTGSTIGDTGRAYAATLFEAGAINRIAKAAGKTYGVGVVVMTHGETDADPPNASYKDQLVQLMADYNTDIAAITGQSYKIPMYLSQQHAYPNGSASKGKRPEVNNMQWQLGVDHKDSFVCTGPKYQYEANPNGDGVHLSVSGAEMLGEKVAQIFHERAVLGNDWQPLMPTGAERTSARVVTVHFHVPVPPLNWDSTFDSPAITEWKNGKGFELRTNSGNITISSVDISGNDVTITASSDLPTSGLFVGYALSSQGVQLKNHSKAVRWGQLRDSDPFAGTVTSQANPNYCVSFEISVP
jgi:hypothetical protein